jgi:photosystem II stability/assembly factor-like uncharacterized protein
MKKIISSIGFLSLLLIFMGASCGPLGDKEPLTTGPAGMFVSTDKGEEWIPISNMPTIAGVTNLNQSSVYRLFDDPLDNNAFYWATRGQGMFYTYDEGNTWQQSVPPMNVGFIYGIAVNPEDKCTIYATNGTLVYKTDDCSRSWSEVYREDVLGVRLMSLTFDFTEENNIFLVKSNGDILRSNDLGDSWVTVDRVGAELMEIKASPVDGKLYAASRKIGLFTTKDGGDSWATLIEKQKQFSGALEFRRFYLHPKKADVLFWISTYGILKSEDAGDTWKSIELITAPGSVKIYGFAINPNNDEEMYYTATHENRSVFYRSEDGGKNWTTKKLPSGQIPTHLRVHPEKGNIIYLGFTIPPKE